MPPIATGSSGVNPGDDGGVLTGSPEEVGGVLPGVPTGGGAATLLGLVFFIAMVDNALSKTIFCWWGCVPTLFYRLMDAYKARAIGKHGFNLKQ